MIPSPRLQAVIQAINRSPLKAIILALWGRGSRPVGSYRGNFAGSHREIYDRLIKKYCKYELLGWQVRDAYNFKILPCSVTPAAFNMLAGRVLISILQWDTKVFIKVGNPESVKPHTQTMVLKFLPRVTERGVTLPIDEELPSRLSISVSEVVPNRSLRTLKLGPKTIVGSALYWCKRSSSKDRSLMLALKLQGNDKWEFTEIRATERQLFFHEDRLSSFTREERVCDLLLNGLDLAF